MKLATFSCGCVGLIDDDWGEYKEALILRACDRDQGRDLSFFYRTYREIEGDKAVVTAKVGLRSDELEALRREFSAVFYHAYKWRVLVNYLKGDMENG